MPKPTSAADAVTSGGHTPVRVTIVTMDTHLASATERARHSLAREVPGLQLSLHAASEFANNEAAIER